MTFCHFLMSRIWKCTYKNFYIKVTKEKSQREEMKIMKSIFYMNGKKTTRKEMNEILGSAVVRELVMRAKETYYSDPNIQNDFYLGTYGFVTIIFN